MHHRIFRGRILHSRSAELVEYLEDGVLAVSEAGRIDFCLPWEAYEQQAVGPRPEIELLSPTQVILPGLIDMHVHLPQFEATGLQAPTLLDWLETHIFPAEAAFSNQSHAERVSRAFFTELLKNGTTTAAVFLTSHTEAARIAFRCAEELGNRVIMGLNLMDCHGPDTLVRPTEEMLTDTEALCREWHGKAEGRLRYAWMPRFALTSSESLLQGLGTLRAKYPEVYFHTHLSEQPTEVQAVLHTFPWAEHYLGVYDRFRLLGERTILAHGIHLSDGELDRLASTHSALTHCPGSNFFLKSGRFRWFDVMQKNVLFGLGSDVGAGPELSIFKAMKDAQSMQAEQTIALPALFYAATLGAARALHMENALGNLQTGKWADFMIADLAEKSAIPKGVAQPDADTLLSWLVYLGDDRLVVRTFVQGREVYRKGTEEVRAAALR